MLCLAASHSSNPFSADSFPSLTLEGCCGQGTASKFWRGTTKDANNCFGIRKLSAIHLQFMGPKALPAIRGKLCEEKNLEIPILRVSMLLYRVSVCQKKGNEK